MEATWTKVFRPTSFWSRGGRCWGWGRRSGHHVAPSSVHLHGGHKLTLRGQRHPPDSLRASYTPPLPPSVTQDVENPTSKRGPGTRTPARAPPARTVGFFKVQEEFCPVGTFVTSSKWEKHTHSHCI